MLETVRSVGLALFVEVAVRMTSLPTMARWFGIALDLSTPTQAVVAVPPTPPFNRTEVRRVRSALRVMAFWPFGQGTCLRQSLVVGQRLRHREPVLRVGVRNGAGGVEGHAWLEVAGTNIGGDESFWPLLNRSPEVADNRGEAGNV
jgi:Transglutaminase-like superfamily